MTKLVWDKVGQRIYESGVDRGVLYVKSGSGVPWNGLIAVTESPTSGSNTSFYQDGVAYLSSSTPEEFAATIEAFTYPDEFALCDGTAEVERGFSATQQDRVTFGMSYRTKIGNDTQGPDYGYKIHIIYNASAQPSSRKNSTVAAQVDPLNFSWSISTTPVDVPNKRASAHLIIDSTKVPAYILKAIEDLLYGSVGQAPTLPSPSDVLAAYSIPEVIPFSVVNNFDGTYTVTGDSDSVIDLGNGAFQITDDSIVVTGGQAKIGT